MSTAAAVTQLRLAFLLLAAPSGWLGREMRSHHLGQGQL